MLAHAECNKACGGNVADLRSVSAGNGSNINSAHESNNELSGDPSAITQENSGQSTSEYDVVAPNSTTQEPQVSDCQLEGITKSLVMTLWHSLGHATSSLRAWY